MIGPMQKRNQLKTSLKLRYKDALAGIIGVVLPILAIRRSVNHLYFDPAVSFGVAFAGLVGYYRGAIKTEQIITGDKKWEVI